MSRKIQVAHVITQLELGGAQQNTLYTVQQLDRRQFRPILLAGSGGVLDAQAQKLDDVPFVHIADLQRRIDPFKDSRAISQLRQVLQKLPRPLVVHTHSSKAGVLGRLAARQIGADAIVHTVHGFGFHPGQSALKQKFYQSIERGLGPFADAYVCVSDADRQTGLRLGLFADAQVEIIRSGIVFEDFAFSTAARTRLRQQIGIAQDAPVVGTVANFKAQKAPLDFVETARRVLQQKPDTHFVYVGDGPMRPQVEQALRKAQIAERVHLVGWKQDVPAWLSVFDVFLLSSAHEGLPRSVLQALSNGCELLATDTGGTREVLPAERLAAPGDVTTLSSRLVAILDTIDLSGSVVRRGRQLVPEVLRGFDADTMVRRQERLYRGLVHLPQTAGADLL